ncbi:MAG TPA: copper amine oxidase N-terminal domain-containing protein [Candidatus Baltobacteraceae bacterium]|nr:copper amine oxidase N-terminal domain-containing protein [Candidatus Baltobacteraceae bacterium]
MRRQAAAFLCAVAVLGAAHVAPSKSNAKHVGKQVLPIAVVLNGTKLSVEPAPTFYKDHLMVPVRRILTSLGLDFEKEGRLVRTHAGAKTITLQIGSATATVDNEPVQLDAAPVEIKNVLYAPLRFFTDALGAQAVFDRQTRSVEIISTLLGRSGNGMVMSSGGGLEQTGTITGVDLESDPPTLTISYNASVRTLQIRPDVVVISQDVNTGTTNAGDLEHVRAGDFAQLRVDRGGRIKQIVDAFGTRNGTVASVGGSQLVLDDGHVIAPSRSTTISLNGSNATLDQIEIGDSVMVRYNIDSSEPLDIVAARKIAAPLSNVAGVAIHDVAIAPVRPLRAGDTLQVTMNGTPSGDASFDIGPYVRSLPLTQSAPGVYTGSYVIPKGVNFANAPVIGRLNVHGTQAPRVASQATVSVSTEPPGINDFAPDNGATVNNPRPSIYATFTTNSVPVNASSARLVVNGHDITSSTMRTERFIDYTPSLDYPNGEMRVTVIVADAAGNVTTKSWTFYIKK